MHFNIEFLEFFMIFCLTKMVNKCVVFSCSSGYYANREKVSTFSFPLGKSDLLEKWVKFVKCNDSFPMKNSVLCIKHFDKKSILKGKWNKLNSYNPFRKNKKPSLLPTATELSSLLNSDEVFFNQMNYKIFFQLTR